MSTIFYSLSGEGRGHASRARTVVEDLRVAGHKVVLFAPDLAYELLAPTFAVTDVPVVPIPGLRFSYTKNGRVNLFGTLIATAAYRAMLGRRIDGLLPHFDREQPDLVIADFEPILPRAARRLGVPFISLDHQHYLVVNDLRDLPFSLRQRAALSAPFVNALYDWQDETIVSSFYAPPLRPDCRNVTQAGVLLRPELRRLRPRNDGFLLCYMRRFASEGLLDALSATGMPVRFYGLGVRPREGMIEFLAVDERRFMDDLSGCEAVICTAGNQLVGEAFSLGKPVLGIPEPRNFEQEINAHYITSSGGGVAVHGTMAPAAILDFLDSIDRYRLHIDRSRMCGNETVKRAIERHLRSSKGEAVRTATGERSSTSPLAA